MIIVLILLSIYRTTFVLPMYTLLIYIIDICYLIKIMIMCSTLIFTIEILFNNINNFITNCYKII